MLIKQLCNYKVCDFASALGLREHCETFEKQALGIPEGESRLAN